MKNTSVFKLHAAKGSQYNFIAKDSTKHSEIALLGDIGVVAGGASALLAVVLPGYTDADHWYLANLTDRNCIFLGTVAVLGATGSEHATDTALRTFNSHFGNVAQVYDVVESEAFVLSRLLDHEGRAQYKGRVTYDEISNISRKTTLKPVEWLNSESAELVSHSSMPVLMQDMCKADGSRSLYDSATAQDIYQSLLVGAEIAEYDSIISQVSRMDGLSNRILVAMNKAGDKVKPVNVTKTDPFKKNGVVNIAQIFEMDDGQTVTIVYHNPDSTPTKLDPKDLVTSWKFLLNKRDVSAVLQPKSGKDVKIPMLAKRMMMIVEANSARFKRNQERQLKAENTLIELQKIEQEKQAELTQLDQEIDSLQKQLDVPLETHVSGEAPTPEPQPGFEAAVTRYNIKSLNKRARKPEGLIKFSTRPDGEYDVHMEQGSVGGDYVGTIDGAKSWLEGRMQSLSDALDGQSSWDRIAARLALVSGDDILNLVAAEVKPEPQPVQEKKNDLGAAEQARFDWGRKVSVMLRDAAENGRPKFIRNIDGVIDLAKNLIQQNKLDGDVVVDELQYILNQVPEMRQYTVVMPKSDRVTAGKISNKIRRLNVALKEADTPLQVTFDKDDKQVRVIPSDKRFHVANFLKDRFEDKYTNVSTLGEYGPLLPIIESYLNEDPAVDRQQVSFSLNPNVVDTASRKIATPLYEYLMEGVEEAQAKFKANSAKKNSSGLVGAIASEVLEVAKTLDPIFAAADEVSNAASNVASNVASSVDINTPVVSTGIDYQDAERLIADLKKLNEDPNFGGNDRYSYFFKRIQRAVDGEDQEAIDWANKWIAELDQAQTDKKTAQQEEAARVKENLANAPKTERHQLWEQAQALGDTTPYISWIPARTSEFLKENPEYTNLLGGTRANQEAYQTAFDAFLNKYVGELEASQKQTPEDSGMTAEQTNPDEAWLDQIIAGDLDLSGLDMDQFSEVATKYAADTSTPIYAKLEQALNAITSAKVAKAQGV